MMTEKFYVGAGGADIQPPIFAQSFSRLKGQQDYLLN
jgi:hypothetical protein